MKRALVTGAGARIGREMALYLGQKGYDVAVHYATSHQAAEEVAELLRGMGRNAIALQADLLDESAVQNLVPATMQALGGPITCLINNASIFEYDNIADGYKMIGNSVPVQLAYVLGSSIINQFDLYYKENLGSFKSKEPLNLSISNK